MIEHISTCTLRTLSNTCVGRNADEYGINLASMLEGSNTRLESALHPHIIAVSPTMPGTGKEIQTSDMNHTNLHGGVCGCVR